MWTQANKVNREQMAVIGNNNVLVLPEYANDNITSRIEEPYKYSWKDGNIRDADGNIYSTLAIIHTHQDDLKGEWGYVAPPGIDDDKLFPYVTPNKPYFSMGYDGKIHGRIGTANGVGNYQLPKGYNMNEDLLNGAKFRFMLKYNLKK